MQAVWTKNPSEIEPVVMPPFDSNAFISGINNHISRCMDHCKKYFSDLKQVKSGTLTRGNSLRVEMKVERFIHR